MTAAIPHGTTTTEDLVAIGERLGLFEAISDSHVTPHELAQQTGMPEGFVTDWLAQQARAGYVTYDALTGRYATHSERARAA